MVDGEIVAGPHVRDACERHLRDIRESNQTGYRWDPAAADDFFGFCADVCTVLVDGETEAFLLSAAQKFIAGSLFGWKRQNGYRRFRTAFIEIGKGNGKSPLAAAIGLYGLVADGEERAEIYAAATKKDQAMILFRDAVSMVKNSPALNSRLAKSGGEDNVWNLAFIETASFFRPIANDNGQSGPRPHFFLVDELHEHRDGETVRMGKAGFKARVEPLLLLITNSGSDRQSVCWEYHEHAVKVAEGAVIDNEFFSYVCALDDGDDPFNDPSCWIKANPELGNVIKVDYLQSQVNDALMLPSQQNTVLRLNFCVWTDADRAWMTKEAWEACERLPLMAWGAAPKKVRPALRLDDFRGCKGFGALDLSYALDLTARALDFPDTVAGVAHHYLFAHFWTPKATLLARARKDRVPYDLWEKQELIEATPGKVIPMAAVARQMADDEERFKIEFFAYDRYRHKDLQEKFKDAGFDPPMIEHPQGFRRANRLEHDVAARFALYDEYGKPAENPLYMPASIEEFEHAIIEERLHTPKHEVLRWNVSGVTPRDDPAGTGNKVFDKRKATGRIDGAVAAAMAIGAATARFGNGGSALDDFLNNPVMTR